MAEDLERLDVLVRQVAAPQVRNHAGPLRAVDFDPPRVRRDFQRRDFDDPERLSNSNSATPLSTKSFGSAV